MTWRVIAESFATADMSNQRVYQPMTPPNNIVVSGALTQIAIVDDPAFTTLTLKLYSNQGGAPGSLIATATCPYSKAQIHTLDHALKRIPFLFTTDQTLRGGETYHWVLNGTGYTGADQSYIGWVHGYPDPEYQTNVDMSFEAQGISPFRVILLGARL